MSRSAEWASSVLPALVLSLAASACRAPHRSAPAAEPPPEPSPAEPRPPEPAAPFFLVVAGERVPTRAPVVPWFAPPYYDAYRTAPRFPTAQASRGAGAPTGLRYTPGRDVASFREGAGSEAERVRQAVDLFVLHYDVCGTSRRCFRVLQDQRGLSVHFLLDADGTLYQTLDLVDQAWHAHQANPRSIGIEIAQLGAYPPDAAATLERWYARDALGPRLVFPPGVAPPPGIAASGRTLRPARGELVSGDVHGARFVQYDFTPEQYDSLAELTATLVEVFPRLRLDAPRDAAGRVRTDALSDAELARYSGLLGHSHVSATKRDPGPAFDWERLLAAVRALRARP